MLKEVNLQIAKYTIHFGDMNYQEYTFHTDEDRRRRFKMRNKDCMIKYDEFISVYLPYHLLW